MNPSVPVADDRAALWRRALAAPLSVRLVITYVMLVAATLFVVAGLAVLFTRMHLSTALNEDLSGTVASFQRGPAADVSSAADLAAEARAWLAASALPEGQAAVVRTAEDEYLTTPGDLMLWDVHGWETALEADAGDLWVLEGPDGFIRGVTVPLMLDGQQVGTLAVAASETSHAATVDALLSHILLASAAGLAFAAVLGFAAIRRTLRPLVRMTKRIEDIQAADDLSRRIEHVGPTDEAGRLAAAFNRLLGRLEASFQAHRQFLSDASHELRTPLTVARGKVELLAEEVRERPRDRKTLQLALGELDRMSRIVQDLLLLARLDEGLTLERKPVEVALVAEEAVLRAMLLAPRGIHVEVEPGLHALADGDRLLQVVTNLTTNAVRHAGDDARVTLSAWREGGQAVIAVSDTGRGIPAEDLPHIFDRLYQGGDTGARTRGGAGLGLAIVSSLVSAMHGAITLDSERGVGTTFTITLPAAPAPAPRLLRSTA